METQNGSKDYFKWHHERNKPYYEKEKETLQVCSLMLSSNPLPCICLSNIIVVIKKIILKLPFLTNFNV